MALCLQTETKQQTFRCVPTLKNQRVIELLKTCIILYFSESLNTLSFPLRLTSFVSKMKAFIQEIHTQRAHVSRLLIIPSITNGHKITHTSYTLHEIITSSSQTALLSSIKQILYEIQSITTADESKLLKLSQRQDNTHTVITWCDISCMRHHFKSLLTNINALSQGNKARSLIPKKRTWHELHDSDLLFSSNFYYPLNKRRRVDISDSKHNEKILQRIPLSISSNGNKLVSEIQEEMSDLLDYKSYKNMSYLSSSRQVIDIIRTPSTKDILVQNLYSTKNDAAVNEFCAYGTKYQCKIALRSQNPSLPLLSLRSCDKIHFIRIMRAHTQPTLGDCSYLDGCRHMDTCRFIHYVVDEECVSRKRPYFRARKYLNRLLRHNRNMNKPINDVNNAYGDEGMESDSSINTQVLNEQIYQNPAIHRYAAQWINCDVRALEFNVLNKYGVIMADPPWDIHMELPYGTLTDEEMLDLNVGQLADDNCLLFLWVTGRVMETARKCMKHWGFECQEEVLWIKTNQLQRIIRTGRTGHWLNHSKEHCLVGVKGNDIGWNRCLDCDVIVAEVRETSRKPDEIYNLMERLSPGTEKIELFGRPHNARPGWMTLGNQLSGTRILDKGIYNKFKELYPTIQVKTRVDDDEDEDDSTSASESDSSSSGSESESSSESDTESASSEESTARSESSSSSPNSESDYDSDSQSDSENDKYHKAKHKSKRR